MGKNIGSNKNTKRHPNVGGQWADQVKEEYDKLVGEPSFVAVKLFTLEYPEYSVRKYK